MQTKVVIVSHTIGLVKDNGGHLVNQPYLLITF